MGQYYSIALKDSEGIKVSHRKVENEGYILAKLMEHSWIGNLLMDCVAAHIYNNKSNLAWVGDYAETEEVDTITNGEISYDNVWGENSDNNFVFRNIWKRIGNTARWRGFTYRGKFLVNHTKKVYISFDEYINTIKKHEGKNKNWFVNPISLLTAIGNGRGGGDYSYGINKDKVGIWAWDVLEIVTAKNLPKDYYKNSDIVFSEDTEKWRDIED